MLYAFDFDDTLCSTRQCIRTSSHGRISTKDYSLLDKGTIKLVSRDAFCEFKDSNIRRNPLYTKATVWDNFADALRAGAPIAIITARANSPQVLKKYIAAIALTEEGVQLHDDVVVYCCGKSNFLERELHFLAHRKLSATQCKALALSHFISKYAGAFESVDYFDDDVSNICTIEDLFPFLRTVYPHANFKTHVVT